VTFTGSLPPSVTGKDVIVALCGLLNQDQVLNHAIEFAGSDEAIQSLTIDDRLAIANMTTEWGALTGLFPMDAVLHRWLKEKIARAAQNPGLPSTTRRLSEQRLEASFNNQLRADPGAHYAKRLYLNLSTLAPYVSGPNAVKVATPLHELPAIKIDKAYLVSCTNSRASDLAAAAQVFQRAADEGQSPHVAEGVQLYMAAASQVEQQEAEARGDWQTLLAAGAQPLPAGCGQCIGLVPVCSRPARSASVPAIATSKAVWVRSTPTPISPVRQWWPPVLCTVGSPVTVKNRAAGRASSAAKATETLNRIAAWRRRPH
jgi:homoaconitate hydratase